MISDTPFLHVIAPAHMLSLTPPARGLGFLLLALLLVISVHGANLTFTTRTLVSTNNANFDLSVFPGAAGYNDRGIGGSAPGNPTFTNPFGDGTVVDYNFIGNAGTGSALVSYASSGAGLIATPTAPPLNVNRNGEDWANVWTTTDPAGFTTQKNHNPTGTPGAANTFARCANLTGTIDISGLTSGVIYFPHGTFINSWQLSLTMSGSGQPDLNASDSLPNGTGLNRGWISEFNFDDAGDYTTITFTYTNTDLDGSRARFMGVILDGNSTPTAPPAVVNLTATDLTPSSATLRGEVTNNGGSDPDVTIYWGDNNGGTNTGNWDQSIDLGTQGGVFSSNLSSLTPGTTYFFRAFASNGAGGAWAATTTSFTTDPPPNPPIVMNNPATNIGFTEADINGSLTSTGGEIPNVTLYFGDNDGGTTPGNWDDSVNIGAQDGPFTTDLFGLANGTTYFFRAFAQNSAGSNWAPSTASFTTNAFSVPTLINNPVTGVTGSSAEISGEVTSTGGDAPNVIIYWGDNDGGTTPDNWDNQIDLEQQGGAFSTVLTGLTSQTTYFFRAFALNAASGAWAPSTNSFTTPEISELVINEFMASNNAGDTNNPNGWYPIANQIPGTSDDWIEILNTGPSQLDLGGWHLTDDPGLLDKWTFPVGTLIPSGDFLIVYASGTGVPDANDNLQTNFRLSAGGEYLALVRPTLVVASEFGPGGTEYPNQDEDVSYGIQPVNGQSVYFDSPTPGAPNDPSGIARVRDTNFNPDRGYYQTTIDVSITSNTPGATIYYSTDGTNPIDANGNPTTGATIYTGPVAITQTTTLKAAAVKTGLAPTNVDCQTYLLFDIDNANPDGTDAAGLNFPFLQQTQPTGWGNLPSGGGDYNMDTRVTQSTAIASGHTTTTAQTMLLGLRDIPTISIAMDRADFSGPSGIYTNPGNGGLEYQCSAEFIPAVNDTRNEWQINCGIKVQGGASRNPNSAAKHSMNFRFRSQYGAGRLREELFPGSDQANFNAIALRAVYNNSWIHRDANQRARGSLIRDQWMRQSLLDMGNPSAGQGFMVHVFVNGLYWGVHNLCERSEASHYANYNGGDDELLDARNGSTVVDGTATAWNAISGVVNGGDWEKIQQVIDINKYIDYQIINRFGGNADLKSNGNWRAAGGGPFLPGQPEQMAPWQLYSWDGERTLESQNASNSPLDPMGVRGSLEGQTEYRIRFADRLNRHFTEGGALTPTATEARWMKFADSLDRAIIAESARWGDDRRPTSPYTRDVEWLAEQNRLRTQYFPVRSTNVLNNYSSILPATDPPTFLINGTPVSGGVVQAGSNLQITANTGTVYYTTDGSDPRLDGGGINPNALSLEGGGIGSQTSFIQLEETGWRFLDNGVAQSNSDVVVGNPSYNSSDWKHPFFNDDCWSTGQALLGYGAINGRTINTNLNFQTPRLPTIYLRRSFNVTDASTFTQLNLRVIQDDGVIIYLNGKEIVRLNMNGGTQTYNSFAIGAIANEGSLVNLPSINLSPGDLLEGVNTLAVELHQSSGSSSDTGLDLQLSGIVPAGGGGGNTAPLSEGSFLRARAFDNGDWSAISEGEFLQGPLADFTNLVVSEIMYNPSGTSEDGEWIELMNISPSTIDLSNVSLEGIDYTFPLGFTLSGAERVVIVKNLAVFSTLYNTAEMNIAPGDFSTSSLRNSGEELAVIDALGTDIKRFEYQDEVPWPTGPDGSGFSIVLIDPLANPDHTNPFNWRSSVTPGGSPDSSDATTFSGDPTADNDGDGLTALLEYAFGSTLGDGGSSPEALPAVGSTTLLDEFNLPQEYLTLSYRRNLAADDIDFEVQIGSDLKSWSTLGVTLLSSTLNGDGTETTTWRSTTPITDQTREFIRVRVTHTP